MNTCAVSNVRDHLYVKMDGCKRAEEKARTENMTEECIRMHHDMYLLYLGLVVELDNIAEKISKTKEKVSATSIYEEIKGSKNIKKAAELVSCITQTCGDCSPDSKEQCVSCLTEMLSETKKSVMES